MNNQTKVINVYCYRCKVIRFATCFGGPMIAAMSPVGRSIEELIKIAEVKESEVKENI